MSRAERQAEDVTRAEAELGGLRDEEARLAREAEEAIARVAAAWDGRTESFETVLVRSKRGGVSVQLMALVWIPD
jgi:phage host-nuclease inhibitor protein Gam